MRCIWCMSCTRSVSRRAPARCRDLHPLRLTTSTRSISRCAPARCRDVHPPDVAMCTRPMSRCAPARCHDAHTGGVAMRTLAVSRCAPKWRVENGELKVMNAIYCHRLGIPSPAQPYYLIYYMKRRNKGLRLDAVYAPLATEVVSFDIRSKIRYGATISGIPVQSQLLSSWGGNHTTAGIRLPKSPVGDSGGGTGKRKTRRSADGRRKTRTLFAPCISVETASSVC